MGLQLKGYARTQRVWRRLTSTLRRFAWAGHGPPDSRLRLRRRVPLLIQDRNHGRRRRLAASNPGLRIRPLGCLFKNKGGIPSRNIPSNHVLRHGSGNAPASRCTGQRWVYPLLDRAENTMLQQGLCYIRVLVALSILPFVTVHAVLH